MSIEQTLERIAISTERSELLLAKLIESIDNAPETHQAVPAPVPSAPAPVPQPAQAASEMTPAAFVPPPAPPAASATAPFNDQTGLLKYCMERYRALGPAKGGMIQSVINELGFKNVSEITSDRWAEFYDKCEAL